jgi:hypothetical protein
MEMSNALFNPGREGFLDGTIDADTAVFKIALVRNYTFDATDKFVSDLTGATLHVTSAALASKTVTDGVFDAADVVFTSVASNASNHVVVLFQSSAVGGGADVASTAQRLVAFIDTGTNFPVVPNGGDVTIQWDNGANKIFKL